jgi:predicted aldo/keto reductase-like oxidoreductase
MRFPKKNKLIDQKRTEKQVLSAIEQGVNYFDTAYVYLNSEPTLGRILAKGYRDKVFIASKLPLPLVHSRKDMEKFLDIQLKRLQTDYIDYYLMHSLITMQGWQRLKRIGVEEFLEKARQTGKIRHRGFSYHGDRDQFKIITDDYPWDFCMIQYNYLDEHHQAGREGLAYAAAKGLGVAVMEPLRGGFLGKMMPPRLQAVFAKAGIKITPAELALRWVWNHAEVSVVLSGMNEESHIRENIRIAATATPASLSENELRLIAELKETLTKLTRVHCTGCAYCMPCPAGVDIPECFNCYNSKHLFGGSINTINYLRNTGGADGGKPAYASLCQECGRCEEQCPQGLPVSKKLKEVAQDMESFYFKLAVALVQKYYSFRNRLNQSGNGIRKN